METRTLDLAFNALRGSGPRAEDGEVIFTGPVAQAAAFLRGFDVAFSGNNDHHLGSLEVSLDAVIDPLAPQRVTVTATYGLRDWSGTWDDSYEGTIRVSVVGE
ncbi:hypothetical protein [Nocardioides sp.]|uniref:hypothetical protein n=1 Tax=Nocardioides sp. TaxID=35761 RepID=UPI003D13A950